MTITIVIRKVYDVNGSKIVYTRGYGDQIIVERSSLDTSLTGPNFDHIDYWASAGIKPNGVHSADWGAVTKFQNLGRSEMNYLSSIQPDDQYEWGFTLDQKMNWLVGQEMSPPDRPYWANNKWSRDWTIFQFGTMVFGHNKIRAKTNQDGSLIIHKYLTEYQSYGKWLVGDVDFIEVDGFKPYMMDKNNYPVEWLIENAYIQKATAANHHPRPNSIDYYPRGTILHPVWDVKNWKSNFGNNLFIPKFAIME